MRSACVGRCNVIVQFERMIEQLLQFSNSFFISKRLAVISKPFRTFAIKVLLIAWFLSRLNPIITNGIHYRLLSTNPNGSTILSTKPTVRR